MSKIRIFILAVMLCLLILSGGKPVGADAGGACLGQWSECRMHCESIPNTPGSLMYCYAGCDYQRDSCLGKPWVQTEQGGSN